MKMACRKCGASWMSRMEPRCGKCGSRHVDFIHRKENLQPLQSQCLKSDVDIFMTKKIARDNFKNKTISRNIIILKSVRELGDCRLKDISLKANLIAANVVYRLVRDQFLRQVKKWPPMFSITDLGIQYIQNNDDSVKKNVQIETSNNFVEPNKKVSLYNDLMKEATKLFESGKDIEAKKLRQYAEEVKKL